MDIIKFNDFIKINENVHDTPEEYVKLALMKIKNKLEKMFSGQVKSDEVQKMSDMKDQEEGQNFADLGLELQSSELSRYSRTMDSVKIKYSDGEFLYDLTISINLEEAVPKNDTEDFSDNDIEKCHIKFKKYDTDDFNLIGEITKNINIKDINEDLLVSLKMEIDEEFGNEEEEFEIETE